MNPASQYCYFFDDDLFDETDRPGFRRRVIVGDHLELWFWRIKGGAEGSFLHNHDANEQLGIIIRGTLDFRIGDADDHTRKVLHAGDLYLAPPVGVARRQHLHRRRRVRRGVDPRRVRPAAHADPEGRRRHRDGRLAPGRRHRRHVHRRRAVRRASPDASWSTRHSPRRRRRSTACAPVCDSCWPRPACVRPTSPRRSCTPRRSSRTRSSRARSGGPASSPPPASATRCSSATSTATTCTTCRSSSLRRRCRASEWSRSPSAPTRRAVVAAIPSAEDLHAITDALRAADVEAVGVCLINSYANPANERVVAEHLRRELGVPVCISAEISPQIREYPRMITTACNAATMPVIGPYLDELQKWLASEGFGGSVLMMLSNGGVVVRRRRRPGADPPRRIGPGCRCARRQLVRPPPRRGPPAVLRHGRHHRQVVPDRRRRAGAHQHVRGRPHLPLQEGLGVPGVGAVGRSGRDRCRWRQPGPRRRARTAEGRARVGRRRSRTRVLRPRRHQARGHRRRPRARSARSRRSSSAATWRSTSTPARPRCARSPTRWACRPTTPRRASTSSSTRTWPRRRACTPSSRVPTCAASRCWRSAAPARCTRAAWPSCSSRRGSCSPSTPVCCRRSARSSRRCASIWRAAWCGRCSRSTPTSATRC